MITTRLLLLLALLALSVLAVYGWRWLAYRRLQRVAALALPAAVTDLLTTDQPVLLYFTTETCSQCRYHQSPILSQVQQRFGVEVVTVDAATQPVVANHFGVMTVPSTVLLDRNRHAVAINHGLATLPRLEEQLATVGV